MLSLDRSTLVGILFRVLQLGIIATVLFQLIAYKGYQTVDASLSTVSTKIKGAAATCRDNATLLACAPDRVRIWDSIDYTIPPIEDSAFFIVTNSVEVPGQTQGIWPEDPSLALPCNSPADCPIYTQSKGPSGKFGSGLYSGFVSLL
jgi:P2X purinoceptor 4